MASIWEKAISIWAENLTSGRSYHIPAVIKLKTMSIFFLRKSEHFVNPIQQKKKSHENFKSNFFLMKFKQPYHESQKNWHKETFSAKAKDQLISKRLFWCLQFSQKMNESNSTWDTMVNSTVEFFRLFFGRIKDISKLIDL